MNTKSFSIMAAALLLLGSCSEQVESNLAENPVQTGEEINFGTSLPSQIETRTVYGDEVTTGGDYGNGYFPVYWEDGDQITILCPQASNGTRVDYAITPLEGKEYTSTDVTKVDPNKAGLQWGSEDTHEFFGFYPASAIAEGDANPTDGVVTVNIPTEQNPVSWYKDEDGTIVGRGDTDYAYMWAYTSVNKSEINQGDPIPLAFEPMSTVLEITINGPKNGTMAISSVNVRSVDMTGTGSANTILTGEVKCDIKAAASNENHQAVCEATGDMDLTRNSIYINLYGAGQYDDALGDGYPVLGPGDKLKVYAYLLPKDDNITKGTLQVIVSPVNQAAKVKTLQTDDVIAHAINKVSLPALDEGEEGINYWMSSLDPDIYLTELSWPGSKMSGVTNDVTNNGFIQSSSLTEQFELGIRAFDFPTIVSNGDIDLAHETFWGTTESIGTSLQKALVELKNCLDAATQAGKTQEAVFVNISYAASRFILSRDQEQSWLNTLISTFDNWANDKVYSTEVNANTTLGDVAGNIILRIHVKDEDVYNKFTTGRSAQLVCYSSPYTGELVPMSWSTAANTNGLQLLYEEETRLADGGILDLNDNDGTADTKKEHVAAIVQQSVTQYNSNSAHNTWYLIDLGGYYNFTIVVGGFYDGERVAKDLTPYFFEYFNTRTQNASLGTVYMNFADENANYGAKYGCDYLIQTIIDNNFSFQLRTRGN